MSPTPSGAFRQQRRSVVQMKTQKSGLGLTEITISRSNYWFYSMYGHHPKVHTVKIQKNVCLIL